MSFTDLARMLTIGSPSLTESKILQYFEYRKGKTLSDLKLARVRGMNKPGFIGKIESEIKGVELELQKVLKRKK